MFSVSLFIRFRQLMFEYNSYSIYILLLLTKFLFSLLSSLYNGSIDIVDDEGPFEFSRNVKFISTLQKTLK